MTQRYHSIEELRDALLSSACRKAIVIPESMDAFKLAMDVLSQGRERPIAQAGCLTYRIDYHQDQPDKAASVVLTWALPAEPLAAFDAYMAPDMTERSDQNWIAWYRGTPVRTEAQQRLNVNYYKGRFGDPVVAFDTTEKPVWPCALSLTVDRDGALDLEMYVGEIVSVALDREAARELHAAIGHFLATGKLPTEAPAIEPSAPKES